MKKLLLAAAVAFFAGVNAQTTGSNLDGTTFITGRVGYDYMKDNNTNTTVHNYSFMPTIATFVSANWAASPDKKNFLCRHGNPALP